MVDSASTGESHRSSPASLVVVGCGFQAAGQTTLIAKREIERADRVLFAVADPLTVRWLRELNPRGESLPYPRDDSRRRETYREMVRRILAALAEGGRVCAVFYGHPGVLVEAGNAALKAARAAGHFARMLPGISSLACLFADLGVDPGAGCQIYEAGDFLKRGCALEPRASLILCQIAVIGNSGFYDRATPDDIRRGLADLSARLQQQYPRCHEVVLYEAAFLPTRQPKVVPMLLSDLADVDLSELSTLYVPALGDA